MEQGTSSGGDGEVEFVREVSRNGRVLGHTQPGQLERDRANSSKSIVIVLDDCESDFNSDSNMDGKGGEASLEMVKEGSEEFPCVRATESLNESCLRFCWEREYQWFSKQKPAFDFADKKNAELLARKAPSTQNAAPRHFENNFRGGGNSGGHVAVGSKRGLNQNSAGLNHGRSAKRKLASGEAVWAGLPETEKENARQGTNAVHDREHAPVSQQNENRSETPAGSGGDTSGSGNRVEAADRPAELNFYDEKVRVFSEEQLYEGAYIRQFIAATYGALWERIRWKGVHESHYYEVIRDGRPCHLYFDLEYPKEGNEHVDADELVDRLLTRVDEYLRELFSIPLSKATILALDATTPRKFSRHLIIRLDGYAFKDNQSAGAFVKTMLANLNRYDLTVKNNVEGKAPWISIVDACVYSRNRVFRTYRSCKGGKDNPLLVHHSYSLKCTLTQQQIFLLSLICNVDKTAKLLTVTVKGCLKQAPSQLEQDDPCWVGNSQQHKSRDSGQHSTQHARPKLRPGLRENRWYNGRHVEVIFKEGHVDLALKETALEYIRVMESIGKARAKGADTMVSAVTFCGTIGLVSYSLVGEGGHFCENIQRKHKSNFVFLLVNFETKEFCQKCYDPDCRRFNSPWVPLFTPCPRLEDKERVLQCSEQRMGLGRIGM